MRKKAELILLLFIGFMIPVNSYSQTRSVNVNRDNRYAIGSESFKIITDFFDMETGQLQYTEIALRDARYPEVFEYLYFTFDSHKETRDFFHGLAVYLGRRNTDEPYEGHRVVSDPKGKWIFLYDAEGVNRNQITGKTSGGY